MNTEPTYKLILLGGKYYPVPLAAKWIAQDEDGEWYWYSRKAERGSGCWLCRKSVNGISHYHKNDSFSLIRGANGLAAKTPPPEPGPWDTQIYWIGD